MDHNKFARELYQTFTDLLEKRIGKLRDDLLAVFAKTRDGRDGRDGHDGAAGPTGADGKDAYQIAQDLGFKGTKVDWLLSLQGDKGEKGADGSNGLDGAKGLDGTNGKDGADGRSAYQIAVDKGFPGSEVDWLKALKGADGAKGLDGKDGANGANGKDGIDGKSAYQIAVDKGFLGNEIDWLKSLKGADGIDGAKGLDGKDGANGANGKDGMPGKDGKDGIDGKSAYQMAAAKGFHGSEDDWLKSLKGADGVSGKSAYELAVSRGYVGSEFDWVKSLQGEKGNDGKDGKDGQDGYDALQLDVLPGIDPESSYPRGVYASYAGGLIRSFRLTDPIDNEPIETYGWQVILNGVASETIITTDDGRTVTRKIKYTSGATKDFVTKTATVIDRGVFRAENNYEKGDGVSRDGSFWIAQVDKPTTLPGASAEWRLAVKRGRDGRDAK